MRKTYTRYIYTGVAAGEGGDTYIISALLIIISWRIIYLFRVNEKTCYDFFTPTDSRHLQGSRYVWLEENVTLVVPRQVNRITALLLSASPFPPTSNFSPSYSVCYHLTPPTHVPFYSGNPVSPGFIHALD